MIQRCYNEAHEGFHDYGGRGIKVAQRWLPLGDLGLTGRQAFKNFLDDVGAKPTWRHTLDRIDPDDHYVPRNVRWATPKEQGVNKRDTHYVKHPLTGVPIAAATLAREMRMSYFKLRSRMITANTWYELREAKGIIDRILKPGEKG